MAARELAQRLIKKHGRPDGIIRRPSEAMVPRADKPWAPTSIGIDPIVMQDLPVLILDIESYRASFGKEATIAPEVSAVALIAAADTSKTILVNDTLESRQVRYSVAKAEVLAPGVEDVLYTLQLKS
jgi:hypothetical protein